MIYAILDFQCHEVWLNTPQQPNLPWLCHGLLVVTPAPQLAVFAFGWAILNAGLCVPALPVAIAAQAAWWGETRGLGGFPLDISGQMNGTK